MGEFDLVELSYAKVIDYVGYCERWPQLVGPYGDLKDVQRPWALEFVQAHSMQGARVLDLGGSRCELARVLMDKFEVTVVDPYDGSGNGPRSPDPFRNQFPNIKIIQGRVTNESYYPDHDVIISTSVVEHIPPNEHASTVKGVFKSLKPRGLSVHSIDVTCEGVGGFLENTVDICASWIKCHGIEVDINRLVSQMLSDVETYFLPVTMYMRWKKDRSYASYPWRKVGAVHFVARKR